MKERSSKKTLKWFVGATATGMVGLAFAALLIDTRTWSYTPLAAVLGWARSLLLTLIPMWIAATAILGVSVLVLIIRRSGKKIGSMTMPTLPPFINYTKDTIHGMIYKWRWRLNGDSWTPSDLWAFCECGTALSQEGWAYYRSHRSESPQSYCPECRRIYPYIQKLDDVAKVIANRANEITAKALNQKP